MYITTVKFKREIDSKWEDGLYVGEGRALLDREGNVVKDCIYDLVETSNLKARIFE